MAAGVGDVKPVNDLMQAHHLDVKLDQIGAKDIALGAVMDIHGSWAGKEATIRRADDGKVYEGEKVHARTYNIDGQIVARLYHKDGLTLYAAPVTGNISGVDALRLAQKLTPNADSDYADFESVILPKVSKQVTTDLPSLQGMTALSGETIEAAKLGLKLNMDKNGFSATEGLAIETTRGSEPRPYEFNGDFVVWAVADNSKNKIPLFATVVHKEDCSLAKESNNP